ncbi:MAG: pseudouridine synthase [Myxococcales bacterium]|nr:pseudouridine synthase [Myxococcales bacterium]MDD9970525.1 pseudouridine synthase [Myxococcales bacterium]
MDKEEQQSDARHWVVGKVGAGERLDRFLVRQLPGSTRGQVSRLLEVGSARVNGRRGRKGWILCAGDRVSLRAAVSWDAAPDSSVVLSIVYEDEHFVVVDKPAGIPCHPLTPGEIGTVASGLVARYPEMAGVGHHPREPGLLHRLDNDTSGLLLAARHQEAFERLWAALQREEVDKRYRALVVGAQLPKGRQRAFLEALGARVRVRSGPSARAVEICTELLGHLAVGDHCLADVRVHRAKRHQIRAHMAFMGHALYGDVTYGGPRAYDGGGHALHASVLGLRHPITGHALRWLSPLPGPFRRRIELVGRP